uniref:Chaoptin n=1 Tax=Ditylenchus dipsaci TaxID=166011 RepID=A0A915ECV8_9BILA
MSNNMLTELPMAIGRLSRVRTINFSNNQISKAYKFVLNKIPHLTRLDLSNNNLKTIESYVFSDTSHLQELDLSHNQIIKDFSSSLSEVRSLKHANISNNELEKLEWSEVPDSLTELIVRNNKIGRMSETRPSLNVKVLDLQNNQLNIFSALTFQQL